MNKVGQQIEFCMLDTGVPCHQQMEEYAAAHYTHTCSLNRGHEGNVHRCECGQEFVAVDLEAEKILPSIY